MGIAEMFLGKPVFVLEAGCPSGTGLGSFQQVQADFVRAAFRPWDRHADRMPVVSFTWLTDALPEEVRSFEEYCASSDPTFVEFLASLGLRTYPGSGTDKLAFSALREETSRRGW